MLGEINHELLLVFKINNYLRAIDRRLGNPTNTFRVINEFSLDVYVNETRKNMTSLQYAFQIFKYYCVRMWLCGVHLRLWLSRVFGFSRAEELADFESDVVYNQQSAETAPLLEDNLMGLAL